MKTALRDLLSITPEDLKRSLHAWAQEDLNTAFDSAVILSRNVRPNGKRMPLIVDFIAAQFGKIEKVHTAHGSEFNALSVVGDYRAADNGLRQRAAEIFKVKIEGMAMLDAEKAKSRALLVKSYACDDNPVRSEAVNFLIRSSSFDELSDLARHAHNMSEKEQLAFLERVESFIDEFPGGVKAMIDGFINRVGVSYGPVCEKADDIFGRCKKMIGPVLALIGADNDNVRYISGDEEADIIVPFDKQLH